MQRTSGRISMSITRKALIAAAAISVSVAMGAGTARAQDFINILTGGTSGAYYPIGVALSNVYSKAIPNAKVQVPPTRTEESRVGQECVSTCRTRGSPSH